MTSFRLSELPTPYRSTGASPLGTHEGTVTPPEPPTPPTPTPGLSYFSGTSTEREQDGPSTYSFIFDVSDFENADEFFAKQVGDPIFVTVDGVKFNWKIVDREVEEDLVGITVEFRQDNPVHAYVGFEPDGGSFAPIVVAYSYTGDNPPETVTLTIADPS